MGDNEALDLTQSDTEVSIRFSGLKKDISGINSALKTVNLDKIQETEAED